MIEAFGSFIMGGNFVIGVIVFAILVIVNFIVITKGSGRIAEVAARFTLDAMPGKQMAIDADLSAGLIDEQEARERRRKELEEESSFFGAMDGAAKFVRGDAIAGLLITFINIIGGIIIGVGQHGPELRRGGAHLHPADRRRRPGVADPGADRLDRRRHPGLQGRRRRLGPTRRCSASSARYPARARHGQRPARGAGDRCPACRCSPSSLLAGAAARSPGTWRGAELAAATCRQAAAGRSRSGAEEPICTALAIDPIRLELGYGLLPLINDEQRPG